MWKLHDVHKYGTFAKKVIWVDEEKNFQVHICHPNRWTWEMGLYNMNYPCELLGEKSFSDMDGKCEWIEKLENIPQNVLDFAYQTMYAEDLTERGVRV